MLSKIFIEVKANLISPDFFNINATCWERCILTRETFFKYKSQYLDYIKLNPGMDAKPYELFDFPS